MAVSAIGTDDVAEEAYTHTITHNLGGTNIFISATPNWETDVYKVSAARNSVVVAFDNPAPSGAKLDWGVELGLLTFGIKTVGPRKREYHPEAERTVTV